MNYCHSKSLWETRGSHFGLRIWRQVKDFSFLQRARSEPSILLWWQSLLPTTAAMWEALKAPVPLSMPVPGPALDVAFSAVSSPSGSAWVQHHPCTVGLKQEDSNKGSGYRGVIGGLEAFAGGIITRSWSYRGWRSRIAGIAWLWKCSTHGLCEADLTETSGEVG